nr:ribonuclease E activity regulator RraA [Variovorax boronicumulans]
MTFATADIWDHDPEAAQLCEAELRDFGRRRTFWGQAVTLKVRDDHRAGIAPCLGAGQGRVLVIDGEGSRRIALFGGTMASIALRNGWAGVVVFGAIRDAEEMATYDLGVKALGTTPRSASTPQAYERDLPVRFGNVIFRPGDWVYADADGVLVRGAMYRPPPPVASK